MQKNSLTKVLVTGANGFIGKKLLTAMTQIDSMEITAVVRNGDDLPKSDAYSVLVVPNYHEADWNESLRGIDTIVHVAGIISPPQQQSGSSQTPEEAMLSVNRDVTEKLAQAAVAEDVKQFIYLSSLSVFGEENNDRELSPESPTAPASMYARSKLAGEVVIEKATAGHEINRVHIRPPMVVGTGTQGTFYTMANLCAKTGFSPFGAIKTPYPIVFTDTLIDFVIAAIALKPIQDGVYLVGENQIYNVPGIIDQIAALSGKSVRHLPVPQAVLNVLMSVLGKKESFDQVSGGLRLDVSKSHEVLGRFKQSQNTPTQNN